jgi:hypothetical protein
LRVVLDTCILKLATFPPDNNASALIYELARAGLMGARVTPAILEEYADVLGDHPEFVAEIVESFTVCYPLTEPQRHPARTRQPFPGVRACRKRRIHRHGETAPGDFDRKQYQAANVTRPSEFLTVPEVGRLVKKLIRG